jgi:hypothetical protein
MGKGKGPQCCAFGCSKRKKVCTDSKSIRSDSEGASDEESKLKRKLPRTFHQ